MPALPSRNVNIALILVPWRNREALRGTDRSVLHARHVVIARQLNLRHVQQARQERQ